LSLAFLLQDKATGRARGFGFVSFVDPEVADRVVQEKHTIDNRQVHGDLFPSGQTLGETFQLMPLLRFFQ